MTAPKRPPAGSRSGSYVHEAQRHTERVVLRLPPEMASTLRERAEAQGMTLSGYVAHLLVADVAAR